MSSIGVAPCAAPVSNARAEASRRNGARSRGPKTPQGKARSAQNALKHGFRAQKCVVLPSESAAEFAALEAALIEELAPEGALQAVLAQRVVAATWRLARAERLEVQLFAENHLTGRSIGLALIRDCNGARSFDTLLRYRGGALAELWRALRTLKALQAEQARSAVAPRQPIAPRACGCIGMAPGQGMGEEAGEHQPAPPIEPESRGNPAQSAPRPAVVEAAQPAGSAHAPARGPASPPAVALSCAGRSPSSTPGCASQLLGVTSPPAAPGGSARHHDSPPVPRAV